MNKVTSVAGAIKEGLSLWRTFIATRQEAYNRKKDKNQEKAINLAEQAFSKANEYIRYVRNTVSLNEDQTKELEAIEKRFV